MTLDVSPGCFNSLQVKIRIPSMDACVSKGRKRLKERHAYLGKLSWISNWLRAHLSTCAASLSTICNPKHGKCTFTFEDHKIRILLRENHGKSLCPNVSNALLHRPPEALLDAHPATFGAKTQKPNGVWCCYLHCINLTKALMTGCFVKRP